jgi:hypothetical protein
MRPSFHAAVPAALLVAAALSIGCASGVAVDPAGYGPPPSSDAVAAQVRAEVEHKFKDRAPANIACGPLKKAYHAKLSMGGGEVIWQGYAMPVTMDVNTAAGRRVEGRKYAAMFAGDQLVGLVDYPGTTNPKGSLGFFWDDGKQPVAVAKPKSDVENERSVAAQQEAAAARRSKADDLLIDPLRVRTEPREVAQNQPRVEPRTEPKSAPATESKTAPRQAPAATTVPPTVAVKPVPEPAPAAPAWGALPPVPAVGTKVYLASDKSYAGNIEEYADLHAFANGSVKPAVRVRYLNGAENWFPAKVAAQIYVVQTGK